MELLLSLGMLLAPADLQPLSPIKIADERPVQVAKPSAFYRYWNEPRKQANGKLSTKAYKSAYLINDPQFGDQWYLAAAGQMNTVETAGINAPYAWHSVGDSDAVVVVIGSGVAIDHEDLESVAWVNPGEVEGDGIDNDSNGLVDDYHGWDSFSDSNDVSDSGWVGTAIAGIVGAAANNGVGISGVAPGVEILPCKVESSTHISMWAIAECLDYVADLKERGINITSVVSPYDWNAWGDWTAEALAASASILEQIERLAALDVLYVKAATFSPPSMVTGPYVDGAAWLCQWGDYCPQHIGDSGIPNILQVTSTDRETKRLVGASWARRLNNVLAPGEEVLSTMPGRNRQDNGSSALYADMSGDISTWELQGDITLMEEPDVPSNEVLGTTPTLRDHAEGKQAISITLPPLDLSSYIDDKPTLSFRYKWRDVERGDRLSVSINNIFVHTGNELESSGWRSFEYDVPPYALEGVNSDGNPRAENVVINIALEIGSDLEPRTSLSSFYIDDISVGLPEQGPANRYAFVTGTVASAAIVAGMDAMLRKARPELSMTEARKLLIASGIDHPDAGTEFHPSLAARRSTFFVGDGSGLLECANQEVLRTIAPRLETHFLYPDEAVDIHVQSNRCEVSVHPPALRIEREEREIEFVDEASGRRGLEGDGIYKARYQPQLRGITDIELPDERRTFVAMEHLGYSFSSSTAWEERGDAPIMYTNNTIISRLEPDFVLPLFGAPFYVRAWPSDASLNLDLYREPRDTTADTDIRNRLGRIDLAAFKQTTGGRFGWGNTTSWMAGEAGNRKWVFHWDSPRYGCEGSEEVGVQIVFFERSPAIQMNYRNIPEDCQDEVGAYAGYGLPLQTIYAVNEKFSGTFSMILYPFYQKNHPPKWTEEELVHDVVAETSFSLDVTGQFTDIESDPLTYFLKYDVEGVELSRQGALSGTLSTPGEFPIDLYVVDSAGASVEGRVVLNVAANANSGPAPTPSAGSNDETPESGGGGTAGWLLLLIGISVTCPRIGSGRTRASREI